MKKGSYGTKIVTFFWKADLDLREEDGFWAGRGRIWLCIVELKRRNSDRLMVLDERRERGEGNGDDRLFKMNVLTAAETGLLLEIN